MDLNLNEHWKNELSMVLASPVFTALWSYLEIEYQKKTICPPADLIFEVFNRCPLEKIKVVILGQDPYPTPGHAHGLSFSVPSNINPLAKSLQNIFKEYEDDLEERAPANGDLSAWVDQGVFLLNTILTVEAGQPQSHAKLGWEFFTDTVLELISNKLEGIIFILWGNTAQQKEKLIDMERHYVIKAPHPSPLSSYRGFFGSKPFSKTNELLALQNKNLINW